MTSTDKMREEFEAECRRYWGERCPDLYFIDGRDENNGSAIRNARLPPPPTAGPQATPRLLL